MSTTPSEIKSELDAKTILEKVQSATNPSKKFVIATLIVDVVLKELKQKKVSMADLSLDKDKILNLLGLFKQGIYGTYQKADEPGFTDGPTERAKFAAWKSYKNKTQEKAQAEYLQAGIGILKLAMDKPIFTKLCHSQGLSLTNFDQKVAVKLTELLKLQQKRQTKFASPKIEVLQNFTATEEAKIASDIVAANLSSSANGNSKGHKESFNVNDHSVVESKPLLFAQNTSSEMSPPFQPGIVPLTDEAIKRNSNNQITLT